ncbi:MAG: hypothetical protein RKE50_03110 [Pseudohaliea sp.]
MTGAVPVSMHPAWHAHEMLYGFLPAAIASALTGFMAFALYLWYYSAILWNPGPDGRPGGCG